MNKNFSFYFVATICISIIILREIVPSLKFDNISLILIIIAVTSIALPKTIEILPPLKRAKFKDIEFEFEKELEVLEEQVLDLEQEKARKEFEIITKVEPETTEQFTASEAIEASERQTQSLQKQRIPPLHSAYVKEYQDIISSSEPNQQKVLRAAILTEKIVTQAAEDLNIEVSKNMKAPTILIKQLELEGFITNKEFMVFISFWDLRNKVIHGHLADLSDNQTTRIMRLLWTLIKIFG